MWTWDKRESILTIIFEESEIGNICHQYFRRFPDKRNNSSSNVLHRKNASSVWQVRGRPRNPSSPNAARPAGQRRCRLAENGPPKSKLFSEHLLKEREKERGRTLTWLLLQQGWRLTVKKKKKTLESMTPPPRLKFFVGDWIRTSSWCYKTFFVGNLDFPKIKKLNKVCSDVWTCTKMWKQC